MTGAGKWHLRVTWTLTNSHVTAGGLAVCALGRTVCVCVCLTLIAGSDLVSLCRDAALVALRRDINSTKVDRGCFLEVLGTRGSEGR